MLALGADWIEHVLSTKAEPYLRTPEAELSFVARHNLDVIVTCAAVAVLAAAIPCCLAAELWRMLRTQRHSPEVGSKRKAQ